MGQIVSRIKQPFHIATESVAQIVRGRKRKHEEEDSSDEITTALEKSLQVPKRKKLLTTTQYIYQALFKEQKNSDVTVMALGKSWYLHKVYLCQSPYFFSMFNGSWKESCQNFVHIKILDPKITLESLDAVFGSLYLDEIVIEPLSVISVLATARLFQLDGLIDKCAEVMIETTNAETAVPYYEAGCQYGVQSVKKAAFDWLLVNLLSFYNKHTKWLKLINCDLMTDLISSPDLYVMQTEFSAYALLRLWMFLKLFPDYELLNNGNNNNNSPSTNTNMNSLTGNNNNNNNGNGDKNGSNTVNVRNVSSSTNNNNNSATIIKSNKSSTSTSTSTSSSSLIKCDNLTPQNYFENRKNSTPFLLTQDGYEFSRPFKALRIQHLLNHHVDLKLVIEDNIIPKEWLHHHLLGHWNSILKIDHALELDPCNVDDDIFLKNSIRFGRVLPEYGYHKWRWTGFNFGLDLVIIVDEKTLCIKRHHRADNQRLLSLRTKRQFLIRVNVSSLNEQRQTFRTQTTGIKSLQLEKNEEQALMLLDKELSYPLLISVNLLFISPDKKLNYMISNLINDNGNNGYCSNSNNNDGINSQVPISEIGANFVDASINASSSSSSSSSSLPAMVTNNPSSFESEL